MKQMLLSASRKVILNPKLSKLLKNSYHDNWSSLIGKADIWNPISCQFRFIQICKPLLGDCDSCPKERTEVTGGSCVKNKETGMVMPALILGTWKTNDLDVAEKALSTAFKVGFRAIDTATHYGNEMVLGCALETALKEAKLKREDIFVITKLPFNAMRCEKVIQSLCKSLQMLRMSYVDLYMINFPAGSCKDEQGKYIPDLGVDHKAIWKGMEKMVEEGKAKYIGVCNFNCNQLEDLVGCAKIKPSNIQIELHAYFQQSAYRRFAKELCIPVTAFAPLGRSPSMIKWLKDNGIKDDRPSPFNDPCVVEIGKKYCKSAPQVLVRYLLQMDDMLAVVVGASEPKVICSNFQIFDFCLNAEDMTLLKNLDKGKKSRLFDKNVFKLHFPAVECHPLFPWKDS